MTDISQFMGYHINTYPLDELSNKVLRSVRKEMNVRYTFACANPHALAVAERSPQFRKALQDSNILVTDGVGLSVIAKFYNANVGPRITGGDFFSKVMSELNAVDCESFGRKTRVFYFGSSQKVLDLIENKSKAIYPNIEICGMISPPFGNWCESDNDSFIEIINAAQADVVWVGMTAPKQELWTHQNRARLNASLVGSIGAVFDFFAGTFERAPTWASKLGIEWLFRLCKEPKRMWRRNLISPAIFVAAAYLHSRYEKDERIQHSVYK